VNSTIAAVYTEESGSIVDLICGHELGHLLSLSTLDPDPQEQIGHDNGPFASETADTKGGLLQEGAWKNQQTREKNLPGRWMDHKDWRKANEAARNYSP
jgi:hypothetical protein